MPRQIAAGLLIWKIVTDLWIIFYIHILVHNVPIVLVAFATDAIGPQAYYGKIKLIDFSVNGLPILCVIDFRNFSLASLKQSGMSLRHLRHPRLIRANN